VKVPVSNKEPYFPVDPVFRGEAEKSGKGDEKYLGGRTVNATNCYAGAWCWSGYTGPLAFLWQQTQNTRESTSLQMI
jgi:hypothetical protein